MLAGAARPPPHIIDRQPRWHGYVVPIVAALGGGPARGVSFLGMNPTVLGDWDGRVYTALYACLAGVAITSIVVIDNGRGSGFPLPNRKAWRPPGWPSPSTVTVHLIGGQPLGSTSPQASPRAPARADAGSRAHHQVRTHPPITSGHAINPSLHGSE
jgi:hypothetical protein